MAVATVELRHLLQSDFQLFDFEYEFDDTSFKQELEQAIIDHYYFSEIGQETPDRFKQRFKTRWQRIMPYYNKLYNTTLLSYNPLVNYTITEGLNQLSSTTNNQDATTTTISTGSTGTKTDTTNTTDTTGSTLTTNDTQTTTDGSTTSETNDKDSNYPQQAIAGGDYLSGEKTGTGTSVNESLSKNTGTVNNENTSHSDGESSSIGSSTSQDEGTATNEIVSRGTNQTDYEKTIEGLTGTSYQQLISQERANLLRIIDSVINEMKPSFFLIY